MKRPTRNTPSHPRQPHASGSQSRGNGVRRQPRHRPVSPPPSASLITTGKRTRKRALPTLDESTDSDEDEADDPSFVPLKRAKNTEPGDMESNTESESDLETGSKRVAKQAQTPPSITPSVPKKDLPKLENYATTGRSLGPAILEQLLADPRRETHNRLPPAVVEEALALKGFYTTDKMSLSLIGHTTLRNLESHLGEGPLPRERHGYTTWLSYSLANTVETKMPPPKQSEGFKEHNQTGRQWSQLSSNQKHTFNPKVFERLAFHSFPGIAKSINPSDAASPQEIDENLPCFQLLVNLPKVEKHLASGELGKSVARSVAAIEDIGRKEVGKVALQLQDIQKRFGISSHLFVASWNPQSKADDALWKEEYTTSPAWAEHSKRQHIGEHFAITSTQASTDLIQRKKSTQDNRRNMKPQEALRSKLADLLNNLIRQHLPLPPATPKSDVHPKGPQPDVTIAEKTFQNIQLKVDRRPGHEVTDEMLARGPKKMSHDEVRAWIRDIENDKYVVLKVDDPVM